MRFVRCRKVQLDLGNSVRIYIRESRTGPEQAPKSGNVQIGITELGKIFDVQNQRKVIMRNANEAISSDLTDFVHKLTN